MDWNKIQKIDESRHTWLRYIKKCHTWHIYYYGCFLCLFVGVVVLTAQSEDTSAPKNNDEVIQLENETDDTEEKAHVPESERKPAQKSKEGSPQAQETDNQIAIPDSAPDEVEQEGEEINGSADNLERFEKKGITILTGNVKILRTSGYLHADKVTFHTEPTTGKTVLTIAEENVEIRDEELFATCEHATMNHLTNTIILKEDVVVLQNKDRLETTLFTYNRTTGKQFAEGDVKFKVRVTEAEPVAEEEAQTETDEAGEDASEETPPSETADKDGSDKDASENGKANSPDAVKDKKEDSPEKVDGPEAEGDVEDKSEKEELPEKADEPEAEEDVEDKSEKEDSPEKADEPEAEEDVEDKGEKDSGDAAEGPPENTEEEPGETPEDETEQD